MAPTPHHVIPAQAGIQGGASSGTMMSGCSCVPRTRETRTRATPSILDARLRGHDGMEVSLTQRPGGRYPDSAALLPGYEDTMLL